MKIEILENGMVTIDIRKKYFNGLGIKDIREKLETLGIDRHFPIELLATEVAIIVDKKGILMQVRKSDSEKLGLWGGCINSNETYIQGALRELKEETGMIVSSDSLIEMGVDTHYHTYDNGDTAYFHAQRYVIHLNTIPDIEIDEESCGYELVTKENWSQLKSRILYHQQNFIEELLVKVV